MKNQGLLSTLLVVIILLLVVLAIVLWSLRSINKEMAEKQNADTSQLASLKAEVAKKDLVIAEKDKTINAKPAASNKLTITVRQTEPIKILGPTEPIKLQVNVSEQANQQPFQPQQEVAIAPITRMIATTQSQDLDPCFYEPGSNRVILCVRLDGSEGRHFPFFAMQKGEKLKNVEQNWNKTGYNWSIEPSDNSNGDVWVGKDGTFHVPASIFANYLLPGDNGVVEIKTTVTNWEPKKMVLSGDEYIYRK